MILRKESVAFYDNKTVYDILADTKSDLEDITSVGSMAYTRTADNGNQRWVRTESGWEALDVSGGGA